MRVIKWQVTTPTAVYSFHASVAFRYGTPVHRDCPQWRHVAAVKCDVEDMLQWRRVKENLSFSTFQSIYNCQKSVILLRLMWLLYLFFYFFCKKSVRSFSVTLHWPQPNFGNKTVLCTHNFIHSFAFKIWLISCLWIKVLKLLIV